jgi:hypothetical protein
VISLRKSRQHRSAEYDAVRIRLEAQAKTRLEQIERRRRPGLRAAGDWIKSRSTVPLTRETANKFGKPTQIHVGRCGEPAFEEARRVLAPSVTSKSGGNAATAVSLMAGNS